MVERLNVKWHRRIRDIAHKLLPSESDQRALRCKIRELNAAYPDLPFEDDIVWIMPMANVKFWATPMPGTGKRLLYDLRNYHPGIVIRGVVDDIW